MRCSSGCGGCGGWAVGVLGGSRDSMGGTGGRGSRVGGDTRASLSFFASAVSICEGGTRARGLRG